LTNEPTNHVFTEQNDKIPRETFIKFLYFYFEEQIKEKKKHIKNSRKLQNQAN